jgi:hypothetical protein
MDKIKKLKALVQASTNLWLQIGRLIGELRDEGHKIPDLADAVGMSKRVAYQAVQVAEYATDAKLSDGVMVKVGWTKMLVLSDHVSPSKAKDWVLLAQSLTVKQLQAQLTGAGDNLMQFYLSDDDVALFGKLLEMNGANKRGRGYANKERALMQILTKYVQTLDQTPKRAKAA